MKSIGYVGILSLMAIGIAAYIASTPKNLQVEFPSNPKSSSVREIWNGENQIGSFENYLSSVRNMNSHLKTTSADQCIYESSPGEFRVAHADHTGKPYHPFFPDLNEDNTIAVVPNGTILPAPYSNDISILTE